jgi:SAM-dependent methyltransferase
MTNVAVNELSPSAPENEKLLLLSPDSTSGAFLGAPDAHIYLPDIWEHLIGTYAIQSVLDIGAGAGWSTRWFVEKGVYTLGVEGSSVALRHNRCRSNVVKHSYSEAPFVPACCFDLAWCAGFVQQLEERSIPNLMTSFQSCKYVCLTPADVQEKAYRHVNSQPTSYWVKKMNEYGFDHDPRETLDLRSTATDKSQWGRRGLTFFVRRDSFK